eukprot:952586-Rhodomonas_salina.2
MQKYEMKNCNRRLHHSRICCGICGRTPPCGVVGSVSATGLISSAIALPDAVISCGTFEELGTRTPLRPGKPTSAESAEVKEMLGATVTWREGCQPEALRVTLTQAGRPSSEPESESESKH